MAKKAAKTETPKSETPVTVERRIYKREKLIHITLKSVYFAPPLGVTGAKVGDRVLCTPNDKGMQVQVGEATELWTPLAPEALGKVQRKAKASGDAPTEPAPAS